MPIRSMPRYCSLLKSKAYEDYGMKLKVTIEGKQVRVQLCVECLCLDTYRETVINWRILVPLSVVPARACAGRSAVEGKGGKRSNPFNVKYILAALFLGQASKILGSFIPFVA